MQVVVLSQLAMILSGKNFSNILSMNAIRLGGLLTAAANGFYAVVVVYNYSDDPRAATACTTLPDMHKMKLRWVA